MVQPPLDTLPLEWIRAFEAAGRTGSFTAAAAETGITQAAISQRISNLEARLGARLFVRQARGVLLTVEGEAWLPHVSGALLALRQSCQDLFGVRQKKIVISASASVIELWLARRVRDLPAHVCPEIGFSTMVLQSGEEAPDATVLIRYGTGAWAGHHKSPLFREALCPVVARSLAAARTPRHELPHIAVSGPRAGWHEWGEFSGDPWRPVPRVRFDSFAPALEAALEGAGVLLASLPLCARELASGALVRLSEQTLSPAETYWMIAGEDEMARGQWDELADHFCELAPL